MLRMGRIDTASLAYEQSVLKTNPAAAPEHSNIRDSITNWCVALVRRPDSAGLPSGSEALACVSGTGQNFRIKLSSSKHVCLDGSRDWKTDLHTTATPSLRRATASWDQSGNGVIFRIRTKGAPCLQLDGTN